MRYLTATRRERCRTGVGDTGKCQWMAIQLPAGGLTVSDLAVWYATFHRVAHRGCAMTAPPQLGALAR
jgi:hypothetical protein